MLSATEDLVLRHPTLDDVAALARFERENRAQFEQWITARGQYGYVETAVRNSILAAMQARERDQAYSWLVWQGECIAGRVNLTAVTRAYFNRAVLGYRIGQAFQGRGIATKAIGQVLEIAFDTLGLWRIEANVRAGNLASVRVLERNGFKAYGHSRDSFHLAGRWFDLLHFECHSPHGPSLQRPGLRREKAGSFDPEGDGPVPPTANRV